MPDSELHEAAPVRQIAAAVVAALIALLVVAYFGRHWLVRLRLTKEQADFWDTALKAVGGTVGVFGAILTLTKYFHEKSKENRSALLEANAPFFAKRQEVYYDLVSVTARISNGPPDDPDRAEAEAAFWRLYWGAVPLVADDEVSVKIDAFSEALYPPEPIERADHDVLLRNASMNLARVCRQSLGFRGPSPSTGHRP